VRCSRLAPDGDAHVDLKGTQAEVTQRATHRLGHVFVIKRKRREPRLLENRSIGGDPVEFRSRVKNQLSHADPHGPQLSDGNVCGPAPAGLCRHPLTTPSPGIREDRHGRSAGDPQRRFHTWALHRIRHGDGHTRGLLHERQFGSSTSTPKADRWAVNQRRFAWAVVQDPCGGQGPAQR